VSKIVNAREAVKISKFLSLILRHEPERVGLKLDSAGWVHVNELLEAVNRHGVSLSIEELKQVVVTNDKKRFALSEDGLKIRASQGIPLTWNCNIRPKFRRSFCTMAHR
jgi:putative RNA 2'-phosphotransferase